MINYIEKGYGLHKAIASANHSLSKVNGKWVSSNDVAVQAIIDSYDPLPDAKTEAIERINQEAGLARIKYVTNVPSQNITYQFKLEEAQAFIAAGYPEANIANYPFIQAEATALNGTGKAAADLIISHYNLWRNLAATIEKERRKGIVLVNNETNWQNCKNIADNAITILKSI